MHYLLLLLPLVAAGSVRPLNGQPNRIPPNVRRPVPDDGRVKASIHAKGTAVVHVKNPVDFKDATVQAGKRGHLKIDHDHSVTAGGFAVGPPDVQGVLQHPLRAKASGRAVRGYVDAPEGGRGNIRIKSGGEVEDHDVPGGTSKTRTGLGKMGGKAKVVTTVTRGGGVKVIAGPSEESLPDDPRTG